VGTPVEPERGPAETPVVDAGAPEIVTPGDPYLARRHWYDVLLRPELGLPLIAVLLGAYLALTSQYFLEKQNLLNITEAVSVVGIAAAFATVVVISGGIDLTPVTVGVIAGIVCLHALNDGMPIVVVIGLALLASAGVGLLNGLLVAIGLLNPFIVTLGTNFLFTGIAYVLTDGNSQQITQQRFLDIGQSRLWQQVPTASVIMIASFALAWVLLRFTRFGTHVFAVGGGEGPARLSGVRVVSTKLWIYVLSAVSAGAAGVVAASAGGSVAPYAASNSNDLLTILAAVIIGGTALTGGRGSVIGTLVGILLLGMIGNGLVLRNISSFYQPVVTGAILLVAIIIDEIRRRVVVVAA
jgi:ribose transport system permease protein